MFSRLFGGGAKNNAAPSVSSQTTANIVNAIQQLTEQAELLEKRREVLEKKSEMELAKAKAALKQGNKAGATAAMKRKALIAKQMDGLQTNIDRINEQTMQVENTQMSAQTVAALQVGAKAQKATLAKFSVETVDKVMDEIQEVADEANEIQQALAMPLGGAAAIDDDEIEAELAELEAQELDQELLQPAPIPTVLPSAPEALQLPSVPTGAPAKTKKTPEDELAELEAEMAAS